MHREIRSSARAVVQLRAAPSGAGLAVTGYASVTGQPYDVNDWLGTYTETVSRGAFAGVLAAAPDVRLLVNHDGIPLARTTSGTLTLREITAPTADPLGQGLTGLWVRAELDPDAPLAAQVRSALARGDMAEMSFAFTVDPDGQMWNGDYSQRFIDTIAELFDVSLVTYPANPATVATLG